MTKVSSIAPLFHCAEFLAEMIRSAHAQSFANWEVMRIAEIADRFSQSDS